MVLGDDFIKEGKAAEGTVFPSWFRSVTSPGPLAVPTFVHAPFSVTSASRAASRLEKADKGAQGRIWGDFSAVPQIMN